MKRDATPSVHAKTDNELLIRLVVENRTGVTHRSAHSECPHSLESGMGTNAHDLAQSRIRVARTCEEFHAIHAITPRCLHNRSIASAPLRDLLCNRSVVGMKAMRCYFLKNGVIRAVDVVRCTTDETGIEHASQLFENRKAEFAGFELWDGARLVHQHPANARQPA